ncbi:3585_t:CDS:2, partial [Diversispora eburnea]
MNFIGSNVQSQAEEVGRNNKKNEKKGNRKKKFLDVTQKAQDEFASEYAYIFMDFIEDYYEDDLSYRPYLNQLAFMHDNNKRTLYVDFGHISRYNKSLTLTKAITEQYYRLEPYLRKVVEILMKYYFSPDKVHKEVSSEKVIEENVQNMVDDTINDAPDVQDTIKNTVEND